MTFEKINEALLNPDFSLDTLLLNMIYSINNPQINGFRITSIKASHRKQCNDSVCKCRSTDLYTDLSLHLVMLEDYYLKLIQRLAKYQDTQYTIYWFPSILMQLGYPTQSLKEINRLLNKVPDKFQFINVSRTQKSKITNLYDLSKQLSRYQEWPKRRINVSISIVQRTIGEYLRKQVLISIQQKQVVTEGSVIVLAVKQFHINEANSIQSQNEVIQIIINRIKFYQNLINNKSIQMLYQNSQALSMQIDSLEKQLKYQFEQFPAKRNQSLLCFYQAEILTNILDAYKYQNLSSLQEEKLISLLQNNTKMNLFQDSISYFYCVMHDHQQNLDITQCGTNFKINYPTITQATMNQIIPRYIIEHHSLLVELFLRTGKSKYYYQFDLSFIQVDDLCVEPMNLFFSNIINSQSLEFLVFIQNLTSNLTYIIVDFDSMIQNYSVGLFEMMNYSNQTIKLMKSQSDLFRFHIWSVIILFEEICDQTQAFNVDFRFFQEESIYTYINTKEINNSMFQNYQSNLKIDKRELLGSYYYIIEVQSLKLRSQIDISISRTQEKTDRSPSFDESGAHIPHLFNPKLFNTYIQTPRPEFQINSLNQSRQALAIQKIQSDINNDNSNYPLEVQQLYFNDPNLLVNQSDSNIELKSQIFKQKQIDLVHHQSSNGSTRTGLRKSVFYSKLDVMSKAISSGVPLNLIKFTNLYIFSLLIYIMYGIILISMANTDIQRFANEIDMIAFHADIMGPQDIFYIKRVTITTYQLYQNSGIINGTQYTSLTDPCYADIMAAYKEMLERFYEIFSNEQIQTFIVGNIIPVIFMNFDQYSIYNITMSQSEEYYVVLQYVYSLTQMFMQKQSATYSPATISQKANYYNQHNQLEDITIKLKEFSVHRASIVATKWQFILIGFLIFVFFMKIFIMHLYNEYLKQYDKYLNLFFLLDNNVLQIEIERQKYLLKTLQNNKEILKNYEFVYRNLDHNVMTQRQQITNVKQKRQQFSLSRIKGYLLIIGIFSLFFVYAIISNEITQMYLTKYKVTTDFYKLIQDLKYASGNVYGYREQAFRWYQMPFYTQEYWEANNHLIDNSLNFMSQFMTLQSSIQFSDYLINQSFIDYFNDLKSASLCSQLEPQYLAFLNPYCNKSFSGVLQTGLTQSLNYIINAIQTQRQVNNFTTRIEYNFYELEGSQIISRTFQTMSDYYKQILLQITNYNITLIQILSIVCIVISTTILGFVYLYLFQYLRQSYYLNKRALYLFPQYVLLTDDMLERQLRILAINSD